MTVEKFRAVKAAIDIGKDRNIVASFFDITGTTYYRIKKSSSFEDYKVLTYVAPVARIVEPPTTSPAAGPSFPSLSLETNDAVFTEITKLCAITQAMCGKIDRLIDSDQSANVVVPPVVIPIRNRALFRKMSV